MTPAFGNMNFDTENKAKYERVKNKPMISAKAIVYGPNAKRYR